jgi:hypothetical protein
MHFVALYFNQTKNIILPDLIAYCWTKLHFVGLNCILSDKVKIQAFSVQKESLHRPIYFVCHEKSSYFSKIQALYTTFYIRKEHSPMV